MHPLYILSTGLIAALLFNTAHCYATYRNPDTLDYTGFTMLGLLFGWLVVPLVIVCLLLIGPAWLIGKLACWIAKKLP